MAVVSGVIPAGGENFYVSSTKEKETAAKEQTQNSGRVTNEQFLRLLTAQLTNQDPLNPISDVDFIAQMAQLQALDEQISMTKAILDMRLDFQMRSASELIGKRITGIGQIGNDISGVVASAIRRNGEVFVVLESQQRVPLENVTDVQAEGMAATG